MRYIRIIKFIIIFCFVVQRTALGLNFDNEIEEVNKIKQALIYAKGKNAYSGRKFEGGYQSHKIGEHILIGQRDLKQRLAKVPYDFVGKTVLDIGTNQGGMLLEIADKIAWGIGIDYDAKLINAANRIKSCAKAWNVDFYVFNLEKEPLMHIKNFLKTDGVDICFFLSMCCWVSNWKKVVEYAYSISDALLFETNGSDDLEREAIQFIQEKYHRVILVSESSDDDQIQKKRKLFLCYKK